MSDWNLPGMYDSVSAKDLLCDKIELLLDVMPESSWGKDSRKYIQSEAVPTKVLSFGITRSKVSCGLYPSQNTRAHMLLLTYLVELGQSWPDPRFCFSSVHVLRDVRTDFHTDQNNADVALTICLGKYSGGGFKTISKNGEENVYDTKRKLLMRNVQDWM